MFFSFLGKKKIGKFKKTLNCSLEQRRPGWKVQGVGPQGELHIEVTVFSSLHKIFLLLVILDVLV